jgi:hypothetical protein
LEDPVKVYNFEVADNHTYFVGDARDGVAVHNKGCGAVRKSIGQLGRDGEKVASKFLKATKNNAGYKINGGVRIPDFVLKKYIVEVKNVQRQALTKQIKDSIALASERNKTFMLITDKGTQLSNPLKEAIKSVGGVIKKLVMR